MRALVLAALLACFTGAASAIPAELLGREWKVIRQNNGLNPPEHRPTIVFNEGGASGRTSCNEWQAHLTGYAPHIRFTDFRVTEQICPAPLMQIERNFLSALRRMDGIRPEGDAIVLVDSVGHELLRLAP